MLHNGDVLLLANPRRQGFGQLVQRYIRYVFAHNDQSLRAIAVVFRYRLDARFLEQVVLELVSTIALSARLYLNFSQSRLGMLSAMRSSVFLNIDLSNVRMNCVDMSGGNGGMERVQYGSLVSLRGVLFGALSGDVISTVYGFRSFESDKRKRSPKSARFLCHTRRNALAIEPHKTSFVMQVKYLLFVLSILSVVSAVNYHPSFSRMAALIGNSPMVEPDLTFTPEEESSIRLLSVIRSVWYILVGLPGRGNDV